MSLGEHFGPHDGTTDLEQAVDAWSHAAPGRAFVKSAGNDRTSAFHAELPCSPSAANELRIGVTKGKSPLPCILEVWGPVRSEGPLSVSIGPLGDTAALRLTNERPEGSITLSSGATLQAVMARDPASDRHSVTVVLGRAATDSTWVLALEVARVQTWQAWVHKHAGPWTFAQESACRRHTVSVPGTASSTVCVANLAGTAPLRAASNSSQGPTCAQGDAAARLWSHCQA